MLVTERAVRDRIDAAREDASRIVAEARQRAGERERELESELDAARARIEERVQSWQRTKLAEVRAETEEDVRRYERASVPAVERMAERVIDAALGPEGAGGP